MMANAWALELGRLTPNLSPDLCYLCDLKQVTCLSEPVSPYKIGRLTTLQHCSEYKKCTNAEHTTSSQYPLLMSFPYQAFPLGCDCAYLAGQCEQILVNSYFYRRVSEWLVVTH